LQLSPDGKHAYSTNFGDGTISVIDTITNSITATLDVLSHPEAVAVSADGERVYVGDYWSRAGRTNPFVGFHPAGRTRRLNPIARLTA
jgi:YVTN family beta-propeller protein